MIILCAMKHKTRSRSRIKANSGVDRGQILEMLRLTPTQRLEKAWSYSEFALELRRASEIRSRPAKSR